jgi:hypothetical protein
MLPEELEALAIKAASNALGYPVPDEVVGLAMATHAGHMTEDLVALLAAKAAELKRAGNRDVVLADEVVTLKIVLAVRATVPGVGIGDEIQINTRRWPTREAVTAPPGAGRAVVAVLGRLVAPRRAVNAGVRS